jgi:2-alkyl-3-oxoalkanoate reductase
VNRGPVKSRVLVTGATGGLGRSVVRALVAEGHTVRATGRRDAEGFEGAAFVQADLLDPQALPFLVDGMDAVIHCAALSSPWGAYGDFYDANVLATRRLLVMAREAGVRRFVFISSPSVYARTEDQLNLTEADPIAAEPLNAYAATKAMAEREVVAASDRVMACVALRPRAIVGPDDRVLLPRILRLVTKGGFPLLRGGQSLIELTDARDVARACLLALDDSRQTAGEVFNISGGRAMTMHAMIEALAQRLGRKVLFVPLPWPVANALAHTAEWLCVRLPGRPEPPITPYGLAVLAFSQTFDLTKARDVLGYSPQYDAFATALDVAGSST